VCMPFFKRRSCFGVYAQDALREQVVHSLFCLRHSADNKDAAIEKDSWQIGYILFVEFIVYDFFHLGTSNSLQKYKKKTIKVVCSNYFQLLLQINCSSIASTTWMRFFGFKLLKHCVEIAAHL